MKSRFAFILIVLSFSFVLLTDFTSSGRAVAKRDSDPKLDAQAQSFLVEQYKSGLEEIRLRIEKEHHLYLLKFTYVGAVLAAFFKFAKRDMNAGFSRVTVACLWATVAVAGIMDVRLTFNTMIIQSLGGWVSSVEDYVYKASFEVGWEHYFSRNSRLFVEPVHALQFIDRELLTWVLFALALTQSVPAFPKPSADPETYRALSLWRDVGRPASSLCIFISAFTGLRSELWYWHFIVAGFCVLIIWIWHWPDPAKLKAPEGEAKEIPEQAAPKGRRTAGDNS